MDLAAYIRDVPDFPKAGIVFKDITPLLDDAGALTTAVDRLAEPFRGAVDTVVGIESRGFIFGAPVAVALQAGFVPLRKAGKLPRQTVSATYELEYGAATLELHADAFTAGDRVLLVDDVLATGGTMAAAIDLVGRAGGTVAGAAVLIELAVLGGADRLAPLTPTALLRY